MIYEAIYDHLRSLSAITDIVGTDPAKIFVGKVPKEVKDSVGVRQNIAPPWIEFRSIGGDPERHMSGDTGVTVAQFMLQFVDKTWLGAETLADAVRQKVDTDGPATWGTIYVQRAFLDDPADITEDPLTGLPYDYPVLESTLEIVYNRTAASP